MTTSLIINLSEFSNVSLLSFNIEENAQCTGSIIYTLNAGGIDVTGEGEFNVLPTSNQIIIEIDANCESPFTIYTSLYEDGLLCQNINFTINSPDCDVIMIPMVTYSCETGVSYAASGWYTNNIPEGTLLSPGNYIITHLVTTNNNFTGCYATQSLTVPHCCPGYYVEVTAECITSFENDIHIIIYDPSGNPANVMINTVNFERIDGTSFCEYESIVVNQNNSPSGITISNICAGSYNLNIETELSLNCVINTQVSVNCACTDCTPNPFDNCCGDLRTVYSQGMYKWCRPINCGNTLLGANCGGNLNKLEEIWIIDTDNPLYQGLFSIQMVPSAIPDKVKVYQNNILIAESPAIGFWNNTFCETDDVLGFWTNGTLHPIFINVIVPPTAGSAFDPWIYDPVTNPGVSGLDKWFENANITVCDIEEGAACANYELGMKDRRGAGELFFYLIPSGLSEIKVEIQFNPNCTQCTQDCVPSCPFCDRVQMAGSFNIPDTSCNPTSSCYDNTCASLINSSNLSSLPYFNIDGIKKYDNEFNDYAPFSGFDCYNNGLSNCNTQDSSNPQGYVALCDGSYVGSIGNLQYNSGIKYRIKAYNTPTCSTFDCEVEYKYFNYSPTGDYQFSWANSNNILSELNPVTIIFTPDNINLAGYYVLETYSNTFLPIVASIDSPNVYYLYYSSGVVDSQQYQGLYVQVDGGYQSTFINTSGQLTFFTMLGTVPFCTDSYSVTPISNSNCITLNIPNEYNFCYGQGYGPENTLLTGELIGYESCFYKNLIIQGLSPTFMSYTMNWDTGIFTMYGTHLVTGSYTVTAVAQCDACIVSSTFEMNTVESNCLGDAVIVSASCGLSDGEIHITPNCTGSTILWAYPLSVSGITDFSITGLSAGYYHYLFYGGDGCNKSSAVYLPNDNAPTYNVSGQEIDCGILITGMPIYIENIATISSNDIEITITETLSETLLYTYSYNISGDNSFTTPDYFPTGIYTVNIIDTGNNCESIKYVVIDKQLMFPSLGLENNYNFFSCEPNSTHSVIFMPNTLPTANYEVWYSFDNEINCSNLFNDGTQVTSTFTWSENEYINNIFPVTGSTTLYLCLYNKNTECCNCKTTNITITNNYANTPVISNYEGCEDEPVTILKNFCGSNFSKLSIQTDTIVVGDNILASGPNYLPFNGLPVNIIVLSDKWIIGSPGYTLSPGTYIVSGTCVNNSCVSEPETFTITIHPKYSNSEFGICNASIASCDLEYYTCNQIFLSLFGGTLLPGSDVIWYYKLITSPNPEEPWIEFDNGSPNVVLSLGENITFGQITYQIKTEVFTPNGCKTEYFATLHHINKPNLSDLPPIQYCTDFVTDPYILDFSVIPFSVDGLTYLEAIDAGYQFLFKTNLNNYSANPQVLLSSALTTNPLNLTSYSIQVQSPYIELVGCTTNKSGAMNFIDPNITTSFSLNFSYLCNLNKLFVGVTYINITFDYAFQYTINGGLLQTVVTGTPFIQIPNIQPNDVINVSAALVYDEGNEAAVCGQIGLETNSFTVPNYAQSNNLAPTSYTFCADEFPNNQLLTSILNQQFINGNHFVISSSNTNIVNNYPTKVPSYAVSYATHIAGVVNLTITAYNNFYDSCGKTKIIQLIFNKPILEAQNIGLGQPMQDAFVNKDTGNAYSNIYVVPLVSATTCSPILGGDTAYGNYTCCDPTQISALNMQYDGGTILPLGAYLMYTQYLGCCRTVPFAVTGLIINEITPVNVTYVTGENGFYESLVIYEPFIVDRETIPDNRSPLPNYFNVAPGDALPTSWNYPSFKGEIAPETFAEDGWAGGVWNQSNMLYFVSIHEKPRYTHLFLDLNFTIPAYALSPTAYFLSIDLDIFTEDYYPLSVTNKYYTDLNYNDVLYNPSGAYGCNKLFYIGNDENYLKSFLRVSSNYFNIVGGAENNHSEFILNLFNAYPASAKRINLTRGKYKIKLSMYQEKDIILQSEKTITINKCDNSNRVFQPIKYYGYEFYGFLGNRSLYIDQKHIYRCNKWFIYTTGATSINDFVTSGTVLMTSIENFGNWRSCLIPNHAGVDISCRYIDGVKKYILNLEDKGLVNNQVYDIMFERLDNLNYNEYNDSVSQRWGFRFNFGTTGTGFPGFEIVRVYSAEGILGYKNFGVSGVTDCEFSFQAKRRGRYKVQNNENIGYVMVTGTDTTWYEFDEYKDLLIPNQHCVKLFKHYDGMNTIPGSGVGTNYVNTNIINEQHPLITTYVELLEINESILPFEDVRKKGIIYVNPVYADDTPDTYYNWYIPKGFHWTLFSPLINMGINTLVQVGLNALAGNDQLFNSGFAWEENKSIAIQHTMSKLHQAEKYSPELFLTHPEGFEVPVSFSKAGGVGSSVKGSLIFKPNLNSNYINKGSIRAIAPDGTYLGQIIHSGSALNDLNLNNSDYVYIGDYDFFANYNNSSGTWSEWVVYLNSFPFGHANDISSVTMFSSLIKPSFSNGNYVYQFLVDGNKVGDISNVYFAAPPTITQGSHLPFNDNGSYLDSFYHLNFFQYPYNYPVQPDNLMNPWEIDNDLASWGASNVLDDTVPTYFQIDQLYIYPSDFKPYPDFLNYFLDYIPIAFPKLRDDFFEYAVNNYGISGLTYNPVSGQLTTHYAVDPYYIDSSDTGLATQVIDKAVNNPLAQLFPSLAFPWFIKVAWSVAQTGWDIIDATQKKWTTLNLNCCRDDFDS